jgi:hypothetical protein
MSAKVVFQADTSQFTAPVERSATTVRELSKALKEQERIARETYRDQIANAKASGAATSELEKLEQQRYRTLLALQAAQKQVAAENVSDGKAAVSSAEAQAEAVNLVTAAYEKQLIAVNATFGEIKRRHSEVTGSVATGAAVATLEGVKNVGAIEGLLAKTLGLGEYIQALFPLVGAVAFGQILLEVGEKFEALSHRAEEAKRGLDAYMDDAHTKSELAADDLEIQAEKLQLNIDKLQGRPGNGLQLGLAEAKRAADELLASLAADRKELEGLFKSAHVGNLEAWLSGTNPTGAQEESIKTRQTDYAKRIQAIETDINGRYAGTNTDAERTALDAERRRRIEKDMQDELASIATERKDLVSGNTTIDVDAKTGRVSTNRTNQNDVRIGELDAYKQQVLSQLSLYQYRNKIVDLSNQERSLQGTHGTTAPTSAASTLRDSWETELKERQQFGDLTTSAEKQFWADRVAEVKKGSDDYKFAYDRYLDSVRKDSTENAKLLQQWNKNTGSQLDVIRDPSIISNQSRQTLKGISDANSTGQSLVDAQQNATNAVAEANIHYREQLGLITRSDAAIQLRNLHEQQYAQQLAKLQRDLANVLPGVDADAQRNRINQRIAELNGRHTTQQYSDAVSLSSSSRQAISGVNQNLTSLMTGGQSNFGGLFQGLSQQLGQFGLQKIEAPLLSKLGFGKADGSASNPFSVRIVGGAENALGSVASNLGGKLGKVGGFFASIFGGFRAAGGSVTAGQTYLVGERGPEPFTPSTSGTILPNSSLAGFGRGGDTYHIDASGSTDPAATEAAVRRAIAAARPGIVNDSVAAVNDRQKRLPSNARR